MAEMNLFFCTECGRPTMWVAVSGGYACSCGHFDADPPDVGLRFCGSCQRETMSLQLVDWQCLVCGSAT